MTLQTKQMSIDDFMRQYDDDPFELINGERCPVQLQMMGHAILTKQTYIPLMQLEQRDDIDEFYMRLVFITVDENRDVVSVYKPDIAYFSVQSLAEYSESDDLPMMLVPDFIVEIISSDDTYRAMKQRIHAYLREGVQRIWIVDDGTKSVDVYENDSTSYTTYGIEDVLSGGDVLPEFELSVSTIFGN